LIRQCLLACLLALPLWLHAQTGSAARTALIIGNAAYTKPDTALKNAVSDARLMRQTFEILGFEVIYREDVDRRGMNAAFRDFQDLVRQKKGIAAFYFAGHGVQVQGRNYIVPVGAHLQKDTDARDAALDVDVMLQAVRDTGAQLNLFILDACRNNPLLATQRGNADSTQGSAAVGLAQMTPPAGALVAFATEPGHVAADGLDAGHGLYTKHLARWLKEPSLTLEQVFKRTREAVKRESGDLQTPMEYSLLTGADVYLVKPIARLPEPAPAAAHGKKNLGTSREANAEAIHPVNAASVVRLEELELMQLEGERRLQSLKAMPTIADIRAASPKAAADVNEDLLKFSKQLDVTAKSFNDYQKLETDVDIKRGVVQFLKTIEKMQLELLRLGVNLYEKYTVTEPVTKPKSSATSTVKKDSKNDFSWITKAKEQVQKDQEYYKSPEAKQKAEQLLKAFQAATKTPAN
jgi:Caspase domain